MHGQQIRYLSQCVKHSLFSQDDREGRKLRRKQSNRESARRSRLRKQAECEALNTTVSDLQQENRDLLVANKAMAARIEELEAQLEQVGSPSWDTVLVAQTLFLRERYIFSPMTISPLPPPFLFNDWQGRLHGPD